MTYKQAAARSGRIDELVKAIHEVTDNRGLTETAKKDIIECLLHYQNLIDEALNKPLLLPGEKVPF